MKLRFQADADLNQLILQATIRHEPAIAFQTASAAGLAGLRDEDVLVMAAREGRALVTHDRKTMPGHFSRFMATETSPGVFIIPQHLAIGSAADDLVLIWLATEAEEWTNQLCFLPL